MLYQTNLSLQKHVFETAKKAVQKQMKHLKKSSVRKRIFGIEWYKKNLQSIVDIDSALGNATLAIEALKTDPNCEISLNSFIAQLETLNKLHSTEKTPTQSRWKKFRTWLEKDHLVLKKGIELSVVGASLTIAVLMIPVVGVILAASLASLMLVPFVAKEASKAKARPKQALQKATQPIQYAGTRVQLILNQHQLYLKTQGVEKKYGPALQQKPVASLQNSIILASSMMDYKQRKLQKSPDLPHRHSARI